MNKMQKQVQAFHEAFGHTVNEQPRIPSIDDIKLRILLMQEELLGKGELAESMENQDLIGVADGLADLLYVTIGTAVVFGIDIEPIFDEVHRSNMSKLGEDGEPIHSRGEELDGKPLGKVIKGPNFFEPEIAKEINLQTTFGDLGGQVMNKNSLQFCGNFMNHAPHEMDNNLYCDGVHVELYIPETEEGPTLPSISYDTDEPKRPLTIDDAWDQAPRGALRSIKHDPVRIVTHYGPGDYEVANFVQAHDLGPWAMNAIKYIVRAGKKGETEELKRAAAIEDVEKAAAYLQMLHNQLNGLPAVVRDPKTQEIRWTLFKN